VSEPLCADGPCCGEAKIASRIGSGRREGEGEAYFIAPRFTAVVFAHWGIRRDFCSVQGRFCYARIRDQVSLAVPWEWSCDRTGGRGPSTRATRGRKKTPQLGELGGQQGAGCWARSGRVRGRLERLGDGFRRPGKQFMYKIGGRGGSG
jgi:hypothetical protein